MNDFVLAIFLSITLVSFILLMLYFVLRRLHRRGEAAVRASHPDARLIIPSAVFVGQQSKGMMQVRGNGTLAITPREVYFRKWMPTTEYRIPIDSIQGIETPRSFLGKRYGSRPLLKLNYLTGSGQNDALVLYVPDPDALTAQIEALRGAP